MTGSDPSPASRTTLLISAVGRWINPIQPNAPLRGALATFLVPTILGCLISPFVTWAMPHQVILVAAGVGVVLSVWSGNFQLWFFWPIALCSIGALVAAWPATALLEISMFEDMFRESPEWLHLAFRVLGILAGLTISALGGWTQWIWRGRDHRLGVVSFGGFVILLVSIFWLVAYGLEAWAQSPRQQFYKKIRAGGRTLGWRDLGGRTLYSVDLLENSGDRDFLRLRPLLVHPWGVHLIGKGFTDQSVRALEGLHVASLTLTNTSISGAAFDELSDVSASWLDLRRNQIGDGALAALTAIPAMQKKLAGLTLGRTEITDDGLRYLARCRALTSLSLGYCAISNDGLKTLVASAPQLQHLTLVGTQISDEGLAHLANVPNLTDLRVNDTEVTQFAVDRLTRQLPRCTVSWDEPTDP